MKKLNLTLLMLVFFVINLYGEKGFNLIATIRGESKGDAFGIVCGLGDINQDGYDDFAVGAWETMNGGSYVKIYFGGNPSDTIADLRLTGESLFGWSMDSGDFNGDGIPDLIVSAPYANVFYGQVSIYFGGSDMDAEADIVIDGVRNNGFFGEDVANGGDINGDGYDDFIVGEETRWDTRGYFYIFWGGPDVDNSWDYCLAGAIYDGLGCSCDGIGDINQDGYDDVIVGARSAYFGKAYIIYGDSTLSDSSFVEIVGDTTKEYSFGTFTSGIGDINNDSIPEYIISSSEFNSHNGLSHIYSGNSFEPIYTITGIDSNGGISSISKHIDFNDDDINDLLISYGDNNLLYAGKILCFLGGNDFDTIPDYILEGKTKHHYFGCSVSEIGNFNGDEYKDIIIGQRGIHSFVQDTSVLTYGNVFIYSFGELSDREEEIVPNKYNLRQNYPNPFNSSTNIEFYLDKPARVNLSVFDVKGNLISVIEKDYLYRGNYKYIFDATNLSSGIYFYKLNSNQKSLIKKMIFLK